ncbi:MAG TPA: S8 family peptidase [Candidatus Acidoferrales bacterium]|jgi:subtilisin family serine protease|nr:S8 family peptidase [Candidatus Acidoferrales bacterium]
MTLPEIVLATLADTHFRTDRILIKLNRNAPASALTDLHARLGNQVLRTFSNMDNLQVIGLARGTGVSNMIAAYQQSGLVRYAEPDYLMRVLVYPDDLHFWNGDQWDLINLGQYGGTPGADIHVTNVWNIQTSASNIIVAVIDTGIRYTHEDLAANMWVNPQENLDGYTNDLYGINLVNNGRGNGDPWDDYGHGTHVAGIIGAVGNNGVGIAGICWSVQLMALKFIDTNGNGTVSDAITCIDFARSHGAKIINASWGSTAFTSQSLHDAIASARDANIIFVAAAGNSAANNDVTPVYPADYSDLDNIISVAATDRNDNLAAFSNYGATNVCLAAPGNPVFSCWNSSDSAYQYYNGTSMAAAHVTGACALLEAQYPGEDYHQIVRRILAGVDPLPGLAGKCMTGGRLNLEKAFGAATRPQLAIVATQGITQSTAPFRIHLTGDPNRTYVIQTSTDLLNWTPIYTNQTAGDGTFDCYDSQAVNFGWCFYRGMLVE